MRRRPRSKRPTKRSLTQLCRLDWFLRPRLEGLEDRTMLDSGVGSTTPTLVVGRTLSAYFAGDVQGGQETITYTVYNEQADDETGVLLTTTLEPGVTIDSASVNSGVTTPLPDQQGQNLAWSLGTIAGYDRASVTLVVDLASPTILQLDSGAKAYATLDAGAVSAATPAATLRAGSPADPSLLASTPDANTTDPFVQEEAAALGYNPTIIFNFLHDQIGYNSYLGSVRGARGTLWSDAGNALDVASLGVALMRASGIPAQYVQGTLSTYYAQTLILSMFPTSYQTVGYIPAGMQTADPKDDPQLLAETESHYWFQYDAGQGFVDADPLLSSTAGATLTTASGTFAEVPDSLREKTEVSVDAEIYSQAAAAFGGPALQTTTVLDQTFNDVELVGKPITFGNFVSSTGSGFGISTIINTYSPYLQLGDDAYPDPSQDELLRGEDYQEILTNFPLGSQVLTGLFLSMTLSGPGGPSENFSRTLLDRIGPTARLGGGSLDIAIGANSPPALSSLDLFTLNALPGKADPEPALPLDNVLEQIRQEALGSLGNTIDDVPANTDLLRRYFIVLGRFIGRDYLSRSDATTERLAETSYVTAYFDRPRLIITGSRYQPSITRPTGIISLDVDLRNDHIRVLAGPGQSTQSTSVFYVTQGLADNVNEQHAGSDYAPASNQATSINTAAVIEAASLQNVPLITISPNNLDKLALLKISGDAKTLITEAVESGKAVIVPAQSVLINGQPTTAWYETDLTTGETIGVTENGEHDDAIELGLIVAIGALTGVKAALNLIGLEPPLSPATPKQKDLAYKAAAEAGSIAAIIDRLSLAGSLGILGWRSLLVLPERYSSPNSRPCLILKRQRY